MTIQANTRDYLDELEESGYVAGWRHANYATAYGEDVYATPERPTGLSDYELGYYISGYNEGIAAYLIEYEEDDLE
jgi:hypothetical protein